MSSTILPLCCNYPLGYGAIAGEVNAWDDSLLLISVLEITTCDLPKLPQRVQTLEPTGALWLTYGIKCMRVQFSYQPLPL